jgi:multidrug efflux pump subunit AcrB
LTFWNSFKGLAMRVMFGVLSLLIVVAIVGLLAKKQLGHATAPVVIPQVSGAPVAPTGATPAQQSQQLQQQVKKDVESLLQQARPMPEDK